VIARGTVYLDPTDVSRMRLRLTGERVGNLEMVSSGAWQVAKIWVEVDDLAALVFATWPRRRPRPHGAAA
jgi:hypothetical protein